ncbi:hypothetical protein GBAR_LOCUS16847, partial [Geodia barretti]
IDVYNCLCCQFARLHDAEKTKLTESHEAERKRLLDAQAKREKLRYALLMRPETAVQSSASFFSWHHVVYCWFEDISDLEVIAESEEPSPSSHL